MKTTLKISASLELPLDITGKKIPFLGTTGSGKSYGASKLAEELLDAGAQIVMLDPVGIHYGLRMDRDGRRAGFQIPVFGGLHGDIPLEPTAGALLADVIVDRGISAVIDISQMDADKEVPRFAADFGSRLFHRRKASPAATFVFLEECQEFIPETPANAQQAASLHAWGRIAKIGRNFGLGLAPISQAPQQVSKRVLNLAECVFAFQLNGKQERDAVTAWLRSANVDNIDFAKLATLEVGHAQVWSPRWLKISREIHFSRKQTLDTSSTPDFETSAKIEVKPLSTSDIDTLRMSFAASIEKIEAEDPNLLRGRIAERDRTIAQQTRELEALRAAPAVIDEGGMAAAVEAARREERDACRAILQETFDAIPDVLVNAASLFEQPLVAARVKLELTHFEEAPARRPDVVRPAPTPVALPKPVTQVGDLSLAASKIIHGLAEMRALGVREVPRQYTMILSDYSHPGSNGFKRALSDLNDAGLISYPSPGAVALTSAGEAIAPKVSAPRSGAELRARFSQTVGGKKAEAITFLVQHYPKSVAREDLMRAIGHTHPGSNGFKDALSQLSSLDVISYPSPGQVRAADLLFLPGERKS